MQKWFSFLFKQGDLSFFYTVFDNGDANGVLLFRPDTIFGEYSSYLLKSHKFGFQSNIVP